MTKALRFPIRLKILLTLLLVVTGVVSVIVLTMANLFHQDKKTYITDLVSMVTASTAEESRSILVGYQERLQVYSRIVESAALSAEVKSDLVSRLFTDFPELVAVSVRSRGTVLASAYDEAALSDAGLTTQDLIEDAQTAPLPFDEIRTGRPYVRNSTLVEGLPTMTLAIRSKSEGPEPHVLSAVIRMDDLLRVTTRSQAFEVLLIGSDGNDLAHSSHPAETSRRVAHDPGGPNVVQDNAVMTHAYVSDGIEMIGGRALAQFGDVAVVARIPKKAAYLASRELLTQLVVVALALLLASTVVGILGAYRLTRPVQQLSEATREIAKGEFDIRVAVASRDEIGELAKSFNHMAQELLEREQALDETQSQLVQSEKLAAFGQLGAGIAHEVKNPLAGILGCAQLSLKKTEPGSPVEKNLRLIEKETKRCKEIIENLLRFARQEKAALQPTHVNPVVTDAIAIVNHQLGMHRIELEHDLADDLPMIHGNANQLQQVVMNLIMNAQQAMEGEPGTIRVATALSSTGQVEIRVADDGPGMSAEVQEKLFEPFFTTKPGGKGTGLGLSVSFGIIKDHGGEIGVISEVGRGSTFSITLPKLEEFDQAAYLSAS